MQRSGAEARLRGARSAPEASKPGSLPRKPPPPRPSHPQAHVSGWRRARSEAPAARAPHPSPHSAGPACGPRWTRMKTTAGGVPQKRRIARTRHGYRLSRRARRCCVIAQPAGSDRRRHAARGPGEVTFPGPGQGRSGVTARVGGSCEVGAQGRGSVRPGAGGPRTAWKRPCEERSRGARK